MLETRRPSILADESSRLSNEKRLVRVSSLSLQLSLAASDDESLKLSTLAPLLDRLDLLCYSLHEPKQLTPNRGGAWSEVKQTTLENAPLNDLIPPSTGRR